jgi:hypothetical protein
MLPWKNARIPNPFSGDPDGANAVPRASGRPVFDDQGRRSGG